MKHLKLILLCGLGFFFAACGSPGQGSSKKSSSEQSSSEQGSSEHGIETEKFSFNKETKYCSVNLSAELPAATDDEVCAKITSQLLSILGSVFSDNSLATLSPYNGNDMSSQAVTDYYFQQFFKEFKNNSVEAAKENGDDMFLPLEFSYSLEKGYETPLCVVFNYQVYEYAGGAYGFGYEKTYTFSKKDGHIVNRFLSSANDNRRLQSMIRRGLCDYFETAPMNLGDHINVYEYDIPLPHSLYPSEEGIVFHYAGEEITTFSNEGAPCFTVPYDEIIPFLSKEARELLIGGKDATEELSSISLELCNYIPDHGIRPDAERHMTTEYFQALDEAWAAPDGAYGEIGDSEWLWYFVTGNGGSSPYYTVKSVYLVDPTHAFADITVQDIWEEGGKPDPGSIVYRYIKMTKTGERWLLDDFENTKQQCRDYVKEMRAKYKSGEILQYLYSNDYSREFIPQFKKSVEEFYQKYGKQQNSDETKDGDETYTLSYNGYLTDGQKKYGIDMSLDVFPDKVNGDELSGFYHYSSQPADRKVFLSGKETKGTSSELSKYILISEKGTERFVLTVDGKSMDGNWYKYDNSTDCEAGNDNYSKTLEVLLDL